jgi:hypothetical protein
MNVLYKLSIQCYIFQYVQYSKQHSLIEPQSNFLNILYRQTDLLAAYLNNFTLITHML